MARWYLFDNFPSEGAADAFAVAVMKEFKGLQVVRLDEIYSPNGVMVERIPPGYRDEKALVKLARDFGGVEAGTD